MMVGMLRMPKRLAISPASSVFSLATLALPSYSFAISSTTGPTMRHGPHQGAQKSTSTVPVWFRTSCSKFSLVNSTTASLAIRPSFSIFLKSVDPGHDLFLERSPGFGVLGQAHELLVEFRGCHLILGQNDPANLARLVGIRAGGDRRQFQIRV